MGTQYIILHSMSRNKREPNGKTQTVAVALEVLKCLRMTGVLSRLFRGCLLARSVAALQLSLTDAETG